jgi:hypothetical protein
LTIGTALPARTLSAILPSKPACRQTFQAEIETGMLADIGLVLFANSRMDVARTIRHVAQSEGDDLFVCRQVAGALALEQDSRQVILEPGDITLLDPLVPYIAKFSAESKLLVLKVPRRALEARVGKTRELVAHSIKPFEPEHSGTSSFLAMLPGLAGNTTRAAGYASPRACRPRRGFQSCEAKKLARVGGLAVWIGRKSGLCGGFSGAACRRSSISP